MTYYLAVKEGSAVLLIANDKDDAERQALKLLGEPDVCVPIKLDKPVPISTKGISSCIAPS